jgi:hypothetical protein
MAAQRALRIGRLADSSLSRAHDLPPALDPPLGGQAQSTENTGRRSPT